MSRVTVGGHHASGLQIYSLGLEVAFTKESNISTTGRHFVANAVENAFSNQLGLDTDFTLTGN